MSFVELNRVMKDAAVGGGDALYRLLIKVPDVVYRVYVMGKS